MALACVRRGTSGGPSTASAAPFEGFIDYQGSFPNDPRQMRCWRRNHRVRCDVLDSVVGRLSLGFNPAAGSICLLTPRVPAWVVVNANDINQLTAILPPGALQKASQDMLAAEVNTGRREQIAGYPCVVWEQRDADGGMDSFCTGTELAAPRSPPLEAMLETWGFKGARAEEYFRQGVVLRILQFNAHGQLRSAVQAVHVQPLAPEAAALADVCTFGAFPYPRPW